MTPVTWLALAAAVALLGPPVPGRRVEALAMAGRLAGGASSRRASGRRRSFRSWRASSSEASQRRALRAALAAVAGELAAGGRPDAALGAAAAAGASHAALFTRAEKVAAAGGDVSAVLSEEPATAGLAGAWNLAEQAGAPLAAVVERVAADLDAVEEQRRAVAVALAGPRSSAAVLAALPALGLLLGASMGGRPLAFLIGSPAGLAVGAVGVALDLVGLWWMRRILRWASR